MRPVRLSLQLFSVFNPFSAPSYLLFNVLLPINLVIYLGKVVLDLGYPGLTLAEFCGELGVLILKITNIN